MGRQPDNDIVQRIDAPTLKVTDTIKTGPGPRFFDVARLPRRR